MSDGRSGAGRGDAIQRTGPLPLSELRSRYLDPGIPVIVEGQVTQWPAYEKWTPDYLAREFGTTAVPVVKMRDGDYANANLIDIPLAEYLAYIGAIDTVTDDAENFDPNLTYYLAQVPLASKLPELMNDLEVPPFFPRERHSSAVIYVGADQFSQLHYHPTGSATLCLLYGQKKVRLFAPDQTPYLYPYPASSSKPNFSRTHHKHPNPQDFPDLAKASYLEGIVRAGEMLFIPIYWWHTIDNEDVNIAVVFFWKRSWLSRFLPPRYMRAQFAFQVLNKPVNFSKRAARKLFRVSGLSRGAQE